MSDIAVLEKIVIVHVWEEEELDYETSEAYLIKPGYAMYVLTGTVHLARVERIYQTGLHRFYVEDRSTASIQLASCLTGDISVKIQEIVMKLLSKNALDWLTCDVMHGMTGGFEFETL
ncbi:hypothetical protein ACYCSE_21215 [Paenibacillus sp. SEL1]|uniref:hypothetical protein n=1 Tax=Paenibacillus TaxID=44249 RepID=UPI0004D3BD12|nr:MULTISPECIES: hypothetical protein [Paenibacillus]KEO77325.1 hypothetical protein EL23_17855 [Paenibacillus polymyxa]KYG93527.1 hypothetical protein AZE31_06690 [Paenibacillus polymyxa]MBP1308642.1 hypothetical protein [Paenibacillus sp. 1182]MCH6189364.1 hypothetical protein [Paenibacillus polymyxa]MDY7990173.1 hypothetical protein [Paenibacillus polymyxa]